MITFIFAIILMLLALTLSAPIGATVFRLHRSDPAGNGLAMAYAVIGMVVLWILVGMMLLVTCARGNPELIGAVGKGTIAFADLAVFAAFVVAAPSQFAFLHVLDARRSRGALATIAKIGVVASPLLLVFHCAWRTFPWLREPVPEEVAIWGALGALVVVCATPWRTAMELRRKAAEGRRRKHMEREIIDVDVVGKSSERLTEGESQNT
jgi:hypothetical protein